MPSEVRFLRAGEEEILSAVADGVFDRPVHPEWASAFLAQSNHHLAVAIDHGTVVGMATAVHYLHPDKPPELWINEVGVAPKHRGAGLGRRLLAALFAVGRSVGCQEAWTLTHRTNDAARRLFRSLGGDEEDDGTLMVGFRLDASPADEPSR